MKAQSDPLARHITMRLEDGRNLVRNIGERRRLAASVLDVCRQRGLFVFSAPDTHIHLATSDNRAEAGKLAHAVACSLRHNLQIPTNFEPARFKPIVEQAHLINSVRYILGNIQRHENPQDPFSEATNLPDLLGLRLTGKSTIGRLRALHPRLTRKDLLALLGVEGLIAGRNAHYLPDAAAASLCLPELNGKSRLHQIAQHAAVVIATNLGLAARNTATLLGLSLRTVSRHRQGRAPLDLIKAIEWQMGLRAQKSERAPNTAGLDPFLPSASA